MSSCKSMHSLPLNSLSNDVKYEVIGYKSIVIEDNNLPRGHVWEVGVWGFRSLLVCFVSLLDNCQVSVTPEVLSPVMSSSTPTDEVETTEEPVVVVSWCGGGKIADRCCKGCTTSIPLCNTWYSRTVHFYSEFASSFPHGSDSRLFCPLSKHEKTKKT